MPPEQKIRGPSCTAARAEQGLGSWQLAAGGRVVGHKNQPLPRETDTQVEFCCRRGLLNTELNHSQARAELQLSVLTYPRLTKRLVCN